MGGPSIRNVVFPRVERELRKVPGIGPAKLARVLAVIRAELNMDTDKNLSDALQVMGANCDRFVAFSRDGGMAVYVNAGDGAWSLQALISPDLGRCTAETKTGD